MLVGNTAWHVLLLAIIFLLAGMPCSARERSRLNLPSVMLWAWERPEDLSFIDPRQVGVAYLAQTVTLSGEHCRTRPRVQPLKLPIGAKVCAVTRIEVDARQPTAFSPRQADMIVHSIEKIAAMHHLDAVQIDFDAKLDERQFYSSLLKQLRTALPPNVGLSITALASWCLYDRWLADLPVDEAVPMMFRMGHDRQKVLLHFQGSRGFAHAVCSNSLGVSLDEPDVNTVIEKLLVEPASAPRVYVFSPHRWTKEDAARAIQFASPKRGS